MRPIVRTFAALALLLVGACSPARGQRPVGPEPAAPRARVEGGAEQVAPAQEAQPTIEVTGTASVDVSADRARVSLAVESREKTASASAQANAQAMTGVLAALRGAGLEGLDIETYGYSLSPVYTTVMQDGNRVQRIDGYRAQNNVRATVTDMKAVGRVIDVATNAGANRVSGIAFEASDLEAAQQQALTEAVRRARAQARTMADALDRVLGPPLEARGGSQSPSPRPGLAMAAARFEADTPVEPGDQTVSASVTITFALGSEKGPR